MLLPEFRPIFRYSDLFNCMRKLHKKYDTDYTNTLNVLKSEYGMSDNEIKTLLKIFLNKEKDRK